MKAVVFGGTGFIGSRLTAALSQKKITAITASSKASPKNISVDIATKRGFDKLPRNADVVFNMASLIRSNYVSDPQFKKVNAVGAKNVAAYANKIGAVLIHSSSASVYGTPTRLPVKENEENPESAYAKSKLMGEKLCAEETKNPVILRYSSVFGPNQVKDSVLPIFLNQALKGEELKVNDSERTQDFIFVDDVVAANLHFMKERTAGVYNVGSGIETNMYELAKTTVRAAKSKSKINVDSSTQKSGFRMQMDISKLKKTGFSPKTKLDAGLKQTIKWLK